MANIMQMFRAKNKVTRSPFELSKKVAFTCQAGELNPVYSRICMQGDVFDISTKWKTRTAPLNTAAFTRFREYYDWFFVPLNLLWDKYNIWSTNIKENNQVATSINGTTLLTDKHPYLTTSQIYTYLRSLGESTNAFGLSRRLLTCKLLSYLGYGDFYDFAGLGSANIYNPELSPWKLLAYQKIFQDWYRNSQWEASRPESCNINYVSGSAESLQLPLGDIDVTKANMFDLQYANWNKDMFMGVLPNSQYGDEATIDLGSITATNLDTPFTISGPNIPSDTAARNVNSKNAFANNYNLTITNNGQEIPFSRINLYGDGLTDKLRALTGINNFTILALRKAEALQKFREIQQSNSQDFPSQSEAHYGYRPNEAYSQRCRRIGGYDGTIEISDVDNNNITENEDGSLNAAAIAGKGLSFGQGGMKKFTADVPGVLMCIHHVVPLLDYASSGISPDNLKTNFTDYAIPEFDKTGMVQVPLVLLTNKKPARLANFSAGSGLLGYAPNYFEYKTDIDEIRGAFYNGDLNSWVSPITKNYIDAFLETSVNGTTFAGINYNFFKVNPAVTNGIFATDVSSEVSSDKFWVNCYFNIHAIRPLDQDGLPY